MEKIGEDFLRGAQLVGAGGQTGRTESSAPTVKREGASESAGLTAKNLRRRGCAWGRRGGRGCGGGVIAEAAAAVVAGDDAAELADHRFIVNFPRELAIGTVAVDLLSEQHGAAAFL